MTQIAREQQEQLQTTAERVAGKLQAFHEGLTAGEQALLDRALRQALADEQELDVSGHAPNPVVVRVAAWAVVKLIDWIADGSLENAPAFSSGPTSSSNPEFRGGWNGTRYQ